MIGISPNMVKLFDRLKQASQINYPLLINGNTGTGKRALGLSDKNNSRAAKLLEVSRPTVLNLIKEQDINTN